MMTIHVKLCVIGLLIALVGCSETELNSLTHQLTTWSSDGSARATSNRIYYNQGSSITQAQVDQLRYYRKDQPTSGMRRLLGTPAWIDDNGETEVYPIAGERGPVLSGNRLIVYYRRSAACNYKCYEAYDWRKQ